MNSQGTPKIADIGIVGQFLDTEQSIIYLAPEVLAEPLVRKKEADIYSYGIMLWEMWYGTQAFTELMPLDKATFQNHIAAGNRPVTSKRGIARLEVVEIITQCWSCDVVERHSAATCREKFKEILKYGGLRVSNRFENLERSSTFPNVSRSFSNAEKNGKTYEPTSVQPGKNMVQENWQLSDAASTNQAANITGGEQQNLYRIVKARSLALRFTDTNPCCVRAVPYENDNKTTEQKSFIMCLYVDNGNNGVPDDLKQAASEMFAADYEIEYVDLQRRPLPEIVTRLPTSKSVQQKELRELSKIVERNLHVFENRLNVTGVQSSYKVVNFSEKDIPCVTVFVLGKRRIPVGETDLKKLDNNPFNVDIDIVEGYFQPCFDNYEPYADPLLGGVSIGIDEDNSRAGTLGGFLKDENGKRYILSCEHVLNPDEKRGCENDIFQPAKTDFTKALHDASSSVNDLNSKLERQERKMKMLDGDDRRRYEIRTRKTKEMLAEMKKKQLKVANSKPRSIGKYYCGLKQNEEVQIGNNNCVDVFVDAAIAELTNQEAEEIEAEKDDEPKNNFCPLLGFKNNKDEGFAPTGCIVDLQEFDCHHELRLMKIGRTTGLTVDGEFETTNFFLNSTGYKKSTCAGNLNTIPYILYCNSCKPLTNENQVQMSCVRRPCCAKCKKEIKNKVTAFWAYNCMAIRKPKKPFCEKGDSGALVFDSQGRVWGMIFGVFSAEGINFDFGLATPFSVVLQALGKISGKKLSLWKKNELAQV